MRVFTKAVLVLGVAVGGCMGDGGTPGGVGQADPLFAQVANGFSSGGTQIAADVVDVGYGIRQPVAAVTSIEVGVDSCIAVGRKLQDVCSQIAGATGENSCWAHSHFFWAHDIPRCGVRVEFYSIGGVQQEWPFVYAFDFSGVSRVHPDEKCGNGTVETGETCDDGNRDVMDGCDSNCQAEPFNGCETVIENEFQKANVAWVDRGAWQSPRSHLMIHDHAGALAPVDAALCGRAQTAAQATCNKLQADMPFVGYCQPYVKFLGAAEGCTVRLVVSFAKVDQEHGVYTTGLQGILGFTIR